MATMRAALRKMKRYVDRKVHFSHLEAGTNEERMHAGMILSDYSTVL